MEAAGGLTDEDRDRLTVPKRLAAVVAGCSLQAFGRWRVSPVAKHGREVLYYVPDIVQYVEREKQRNVGDPKLTLARTRLATAQAEHEALRVAQLQGRLLPSDLVIGTWQAMVASARAKLLALPSRMAHVAIEATELHEIEEGLRAIIDEALLELAGSGLPEHVEKLLGEDLPGVEATAEDDDFGMGRRGTAP